MTQTSAAEKNGYKDKTPNVEKKEIDVKHGSRKGSQGHPPPWFETHCQVVNAEFRFMRHPRADADAQSSTSRQQLPQNKEKSCEQLQRVLMKRNTWREGVKPITVTVPHSEF